MRAMRRRDTGPELALVADPRLVDLAVRPPQVEPPSLKADGVVAGVATHDLVLAPATGVAGLLEADVPGDPPSSAL